VPKGRISRRRTAALSAAGVLIVGCAVLTGVSGSGSGDGSAAPVAAASVASDATATAGSEATPSDSASAGASTSASPSASASASPSASASGTASPGASAAAAPPRTTTAKLSAPAVFTGQAFDTCTAPALATMNAWRQTSPYGAAAVYIGGKNRGCAQPQLTSGWVRSVSSAGWRLIPLYVGAQPPCQTGSSPEKITVDNAATLGASDGADAVAKASALGMRAGSALYLDMEAYDSGNTACAQTVLTYVQAWDRAVHAAGYWAGFYGFAGSSAAGMARAAGQSAADLPDALWYAKYDGAADTTTSFPFAAGLWTGHRRGHQYQVNQKETYGGATLTVDRNAWDGPVAQVG